MRKHIRGVDHVVLTVRDLDRARSTFGRLGFTLTPRGYHTLGSQNHCIMFAADYIELLAVPQRHPAMQYYTDFLATGEGLAAIALATNDAQAVQQDLVASGVAADPPLDFSRPVDLPEGARDASFRIVQLSPADTPGCRTFLCQHFTPELVWRDGYQKHAVGVTAIAAVGIVVEDAASAANSYAKLFDAKPGRIAEGLLVETGSASLAIGTRAKIGHRLNGVALPTRARPVVAALFLRVADRSKAAKALERGGFSPVTLADGSIAVGADRAHGVALVFG